MKRLVKRCDLQDAENCEKLLQREMIGCEYLTNHGYCSNPAAYFSSEEIEEFNGGIEGMEVVMVAQYMADRAGELEWAEEMQEKGCSYCNPLDGDMKRRDDYLTGNYCPFCGRRLEK